MRSSTFASRAVAASLIFYSNLVAACNPLTTTGCAADTALGGTIDVDFTAGASSEFRATNNIVTYESDGVHLTVSQSGEAPTFVSDWYIMFGRVEVVFKSAAGTGMCSTAILMSDDLDEIDWEILGSEPTQAQTNYFGKGLTLTYDRGLTVADGTSQDAFNTYTIDWNAERIIWEINGVALRTLLAADADTNQYPQTPMQLRFGAWAPGDTSTNSEGTVAWAGGAIDFSQGPFTMVVKSASATDYSTGKSYSYSGTTGNWQDIVALDGAVNAEATSGSGGSVVAVVSSSTAASSSTTTSSVATTNTEGTHRASTSSYVNTRTAWPWVASSTASSSATTTSSTYSSLALTSSSASYTTVTTSTYATSSVLSSSLGSGFISIASSTVAEADSASTTSAKLTSATATSAYSTNGAGRNSAGQLVAAACLVVGLASII